MTRTISFKNVYMTYIDNEPYNYPSIDVQNIVQGTNAESTTINTGWHIVPNFLWRHCITPKQWFQLVTECEAYAVKGIKGIIYNPIPITTNIAIQRTNQFSAFNNCTYALTYVDDYYETSWQEWNNLPLDQRLHLSQREGLIWKGAQTVSSSGVTENYTTKRYQWPIYNWRKPNMRTPFENTWSQGKGGSAGVFDVTTGGSLSDITVKLPGGIFWDPFNQPDKIGELRAGKNSISFSFDVHDSDANKFFNLDTIACFTQWTTDGPYMGVGRPWTLKETYDMDPAFACTFGLAQSNSGSDTSNQVGSDTYKYHDYTIPNYFNMPIMPTKWFWKEIQQSICDWEGGGAGHDSNIPVWKKPNKHWPGTEWEAATFPPTQWFCKGIPLYDATNNPIRTTTQVSFQIELVLEGKIRRSAYFAPTHGPWSGDQLYYHTNSKGIFQPGNIRYRTAGKRRTWQNFTTQLDAHTGANAQNLLNLASNPRQDPYIWKSDVLTNLQYNKGHNPTGIKDETGASTRVYQPNIRVTWTKDTDTTSIEMDVEAPQAPPRKEKSIMKLIPLK